MLNRKKNLRWITKDISKDELMEDWDVLFSEQHTSKSFRCGRPKHLDSLNANAEKICNDPHESTTKQSKNNKRERVFNDMELWVVLQA